MGFKYTDDELNREFATLHIDGEESKAYKDYFHKLAHDDLNETIEDVLSHFSRAEKEILLTIYSYSNYNINEYSLDNIKRHEEYYGSLLSYIENEIGYNHADSDEVLQDLFESYCDTGDVLYGEAFDKVIEVFKEANKKLHEQVNPDLILSEASERTFMKKEDDEEFKEELMQSEMLDYDYAILREFMETEDMESSVHDEEEKTTPKKRRNK